MSTTSDPAQPGASSVDFTGGVGAAGLPADVREAVAYLRSPEAIRGRAARVLQAGIDGELRHFAVHMDRLDAAAAYVVDVIRANYPDLRIPYHSRWGHFAVGGVDRLAAVERALAGASAEERGRTLYDLVVTSVLLDAGAGPGWSYTEAGTEQTWSRSEGLAVASIHAFLDGAFSSDPSAPLRADASGLVRLRPARLATCFQVSARNPLVGLDGRAALMNRLGEAVRGAPHIFIAGKAADAGGPPRIGGMFSYLLGRTVDGKLPAREILAAVLEGLVPVWSGPHRVGGVPLGDVWPHPAATPPPGTEPALAGSMVPFHKLAQWLSYSLVEPLEQAGVTVVDLDALTGLAEYRNGGLFVDLGVLEPRYEDVTVRAHPPGSELVIEWRALTIALLDRMSERVRALLGVDAQTLPLTKVLEGGTWRAGRRIAAEKRAGGGPPIRLDSDGTVF
ncbi:MAG TPA: URC4/urg3 family protein [Haliangium sp.]|nr:URC4/urg3 family protein [Haliangium sp.]